MGRAQAAIRRLEGEPCQWCFPGEGDLTTLSIRFGEKIGERRSLHSDAAVPNFRFAISVDTAWRVENSDGVLCTSDDEKPRGGEVRGVLKALEGNSVATARIHPIAGDIAITFKSGQVIRAFCCVGEGDHSYTWDYWFSDRKPGQEVHFSIGPRGTVNFNWPGPGVGSAGRDEDEGRPSTAS